jgi:hypothetical protein
LRMAREEQALVILSNSSVNPGHREVHHPSPWYQDLGHLFCLRSLFGGNVYGKRGTRAADVCATLCGGT